MYMYIMYNIQLLYNLNIHPLYKVNVGEVLTH